MTRWTLVTLLAINLVLAAWNLGAFARWGWGPEDGREPARLSQELRPEAIRLSVPGQSAQASAPEPAASDAATPASAAASSP